MQPLARDQGGIEQVLDVAVQPHRLITDSGG
jgi:hypothetical protein